MPDRGSAVCAGEAAGEKLTAQFCCAQIHERDRFADFLLILLRDLLPGQPQLRVILMSATLHIDLFSAYFGACPVIQVRGGRRLISCQALLALLS
jgi:hypothetical protein